MSLSDLTRNSFQGGVSSTKWLKLCRLFLTKNPNHSLDDTETAVSNSVLILFSSYPGHPTLQAYLTSAIQDGLVSLSTFMTTFLQAARSPDLHEPSTLDVLCRIAMEAHFSSGGTSSPNQLTAFATSSDALLATIRDALVLLKMTYQLPIPHFHRLFASVENLVMLLLNSVTLHDISTCSSAQAMASREEAREVLGTIYSLTHNIRSVIEGFTISIGHRTEGDNSTVREVHMLQNTQSSLGKGDILGTGSETDTVSCCLLLSHLVLNRASDFGSGNDSHATALLVTLYRSLGWPLPKFYSRFLLSAISCLVQDWQFNPKLDSMWRAFILGRLPRLLLSFAKTVEAESATNLDSTIRDVWGTICAPQNKPPVLLQYDQMTATSTDMNVLTNSESLNTSGPSFARDFTQQLQVLGLVDQAFVSKVDPNGTLVRIQAEAEDAGQDLETFIMTKISTDTSIEDAAMFLEKVYKDYSSHSIFTETVRARFESLAASFDAESLSHLAKILYTNQPALDIVSLHTSISDFIAHALVFIEDYDCEVVGDPQTAVTQLGDVVLFLQWTATKYRLVTHRLTVGDRVLDPNFLRTTDSVQRTEDQPPVFQSWSKALFDNGSEGIDDGILRSTRPKVLLNMAATQCLDAISACAQGKIDADVLNNGISYFLGPLLNWTLVGIIKAILKEIQLTRFQSPHHLYVLRTLLLSSTCPRPVICLCSHSILRLLSDQNLQRYKPASPENIAEIRARIYQVTGLPVPPQNAMTSTSSWPDTPRDTLTQFLSSIPTRTASMALPSKTPSLPPLISMPVPPNAVLGLSIQNILLCTTPTKFLLTLWDCLSGSHTLTLDMDSHRRLAVYILTTPFIPAAGIGLGGMGGVGGGWSLLPIFLHNVLPSLMDNVDQQAKVNTATHSMLGELLAGIVASSVMSALYLERALAITTNTSTISPSLSNLNASTSTAATGPRTPVPIPGGDQQRLRGPGMYPLGEPSSSMARRLAGNLRHRKNSPTAKLIAGRLASSGTFVASFPVFKTEI